MRKTFTAAIAVLLLFFMLCGVLTGCGSAPVEKPTVGAPSDGADESDRLADVSETPKTSDAQDSSDTQEPSDTAEDPPSYTDDFDCDPPPPYLLSFSLYEPAIWETSTLSGVPSWYANILLPKEEADFTEGFDGDGTPCYWVLYIRPADTLSEWIYTKCEQGPVEYLEDDVILYRVLPGKDFNGAQLKVGRTYEMVACVLDHYDMLYYKSINFKFTWTQDFQDQYTQWKSSVDG